MWRELSADLLLLKLVDERARFSFSRTQRGFPVRWPGDLALMGMTSMRAAGSGAKQITVGFSHSCAEMQDGTVFCWGSNSSGEVENPSGGCAIGTPTKVVWSP